VSVHPDKDILLVITMDVDVAMKHVTPAPTLIMNTDSIHHMVTVMFWTLTNARFTVLTHL